MKKLLSWLLVLALCLSLFPATALAEGGDGDEVPAEDPAPAEEPADGPDDPVGEDSILPQTEDEDDGRLIASPTDDTSDDPDALPPAADEPEDVVASGDCGDSLIWTLNDAGVLTIAGSGDMWDWSWREAPWYEHQSEITSVKILPGVTSIGSGAFMYCALTGVTIPEGVTGIGSGAFYFCTALSIVTVPEGVTSIGRGAFYGCSSLTSVTIPASVTRISYSSVFLIATEGAFESCDALTDIWFGGTMEGWKALGAYPSHYGPTVHCSDGDIAPADPLQCGDGLIWTLNSEGVLTIAGSGEMWDFSNFFPAPWCQRHNEIASVNILSGVTSIGAYAFSYCGSLTSVTIPEGVTSIGEAAFNGCSSLTGVTIPASVTSIGNNVFDSCSSLETILVDSENTAFASRDGILYSKDMRRLIRCPEGKTGSVTIPEGVTEIEIIAFSGCGGLTEVTIPAGVTSIGEAAFNGCSSLTGVTIPEGVTSIGGGVFSGCSSLTSVTIPESVTDIGNFAFSYCESLSSVTIPEGVTSIGDRAFNGCSSLTEIRFEGSAPSFGENVFASWSGPVTATAYYPRLDPSWTEEVRQNYGGTITWVGYGPIAGGQCGDNLTWTLDEDGVLTISGAGDMWDFFTIYGTNHAPWGDVAPRIKHVVAEPGVTGIGDYAFCGQDFDQLAQVTLPEGLLRLGRAAFASPSAPLSDFVIPESVVTIGDNVITSRCLASVSIPGGVTSLDPNMIGPNCTSLTDIYFGGTIAAWKQFGVQYDHYSTTVHCIDGDIDLADPMFCGDNLIWTLNSEGGLTIAGSGDMWDFGNEKAPWYSRRSEITSVRLVSGVTGIGSNGFERCGNLTSVMIPDSVTSIGSSAFHNCSGLTGLTIPEGVTIIGPVAFADCSSLTGITIPEGVTSIEESVFYGCSGLTEVTIPAAVTSIGPAAFYGCSGLTEVTIPASVTQIGYDAFNSCSNLTEIRFEDSAPTIGGNCFGSVTATAYYPANDPSWTEAVMQDYGGSITWVSYATEPAVVASGQCGDDLTWTLDEDGLLTVSGAGDMWDWEQIESGWPNTPWQEHAFSVTAVVIEPGATGVGNWAFYGFENCADISLPDTLKRIGEGAFSCCSSLTELTIPEGVTDIGGYTFSYCMFLASISLPASLTATGLLPFDNCPDLTDIYFGGPREAWQQLGMDYDYYTVTVHCSDGDLALADPSRCGDDLTWSLADGVLSITGTGDMWDFSCAKAPWYWQRGEFRQVQIGDGATSIGANAFHYCDIVTQVTIPESVTAIGANAFTCCTDLNEISIPESVRFIGAGAFSSCCLRRVTLPEALERIDAGAFAFSSCITEIRFTGPAPVLDSGCHQGGFLFSSVTATAYYPAGDETWTEAVMQDYGGSITWVSYELTGIPVNAAHFPDPIFRAYVSEHFDADGDGRLSEEEIALAAVIDLEESGVASLEGIQYFTELTELNASGGFMTAGALTQVDLSANTKLKSLYLGFNPLESLDVSMLPELESLMVGFCGLSELDLSGNPALKELWCDNNNLTELDLSHNPLLTHLDCCGNTGLLELDITPCPSLVADYRAGGRHISWMQEGMPEQYESIWVYGGTNDDDYNLAVNDYTTIIAPPAYTPGDINGDGSVNNKDVTRLQRYLKDPTMTVNEAALDVNGDGKVNNKDVTRLMRYLKHHDVEIR